MLLTGQNISNGMSSFVEHSDKLEIILVLNIPNDTGQTVGGGRKDSCTYFWLARSSEIAAAVGIQ